MINTLKSVGLDAAMVMPSPRGALERWVKPVWARVVNVVGLTPREGAREKALLLPHIMQAARAASEARSMSLVVRSWLSLIVSARRPEGGPFSLPFDFFL